MRIKIVDAIGIGILVLGIVMTIFNLAARRGPTSEVESITLQELRPKGGGVGI